MAWLNRMVDRIVDASGDLPFIIPFNIGTIVWITLGIFDTYFFDRYPSNFYTLIVSWLAINLTSLVLWSDRRKKAREERERLHLQAMTEAILHVSESTHQILKYLVEQETGVDLDEVKE